MKQPPGEELDAIAATESLERLAAAVREGRLVGLLKGEGLSRETIAELLRPESRSRLKSILNDHMFPETNHHARGDRCDIRAVSSGNGFVDRQCQSGKLLAFRRRRRREP